MKRSEIVKKLEAYLGITGISSYASAEQTLQFLEDNGMVHHYPWDPEKEPKPLPVEVQIQVLVGDHMGWTGPQAREWYYLMNPLLGGLSPYMMVQQGRQDKLIQWINNQIDENTVDVRITPPDQFSSLNKNIALNFMNENIKPSKKLRKALKGKKKS